MLSGSSLPMVKVVGSVKQGKAEEEKEFYFLEDFKDTVAYQHVYELGNQSMKGEAYFYRLQERDKFSKIEANYPAYFNLTADAYRCLSTKHLC